jgi:hypothetical protein
VLRLVALTVSSVLKASSITTRLRQNQTLYVILLINCLPCGRSTGTHGKRLLPSSPAALYAAMAGSNPSPLAKYKLVSTQREFLGVPCHEITLMVLSTNQTAAAVPRYPAKSECWWSAWTNHRCFWGISLLGRPASSHGSCMTSLTTLTRCGAAVWLACWQHWLLLCSHPAG